MIVVDTSALMAIVLNERSADSCIAALESESQILISAGTVVESFVVASGRRVTAETESLIEGLDLEIVSVTGSTAMAVGAAYRKWGKGFHPAGLNFGDCFAYALAMERGCPLLYVGEDFARTDVRGLL
ncbi:MAG TPA: type II toxin-antitoxin system VapC family toxin [Rhizomicrobium sp.]|nr:type II toxin-antitoxin system VapC family toxin [Rhizomicrobium sp.]